MPNNEDAKVDRTAGYGVPSAAPTLTETRTGPFIEVWYAGATHRLHANGDYTRWGGHPASWQHISSAEVPMQVLNRISYELERRMAFAQVALETETP